LQLALPRRPLGWISCRLRCLRECAVFLRLLFEIVSMVCILKIVHARLGRVQPIILRYINHESDGKSLYERRRTTGRVLLLLLLLPAFALAFSPEPQMF
jgi:hypothetical protein